MWIIEVCYVEYRASYVGHRGKLCGLRRQVMWIIEASYVNHKGKLCGL